MDRTYRLKPSAPPLSPTLAAVWPTVRNAVPGV